MKKYLSKIKYCLKTFESETKGFAFIPWLTGMAIVGAVGYFAGDKILETAAVIVAWFMQEVVAGIASVIMSLAGLLLDHTINFSLSYNIGDLAAVQLGWTITRDLANLSFLFIILYIAIATILQLSSYGMKDLLVKVVVVALLINFSLMITKVIIDSSNILALEFYTAMGAGEKSISTHIMAGLELEKVYKLPENLSPLIEIKVAFFSAILYLMTAYVFFGGVFLFIARMVTFVFLMVLAPIAFVSMILPKTKEISQRWWKTLFEQSFVAPAYLFFIYVVVKIINDGALKMMIDKTNTDEVLSMSMVLNFIILIGLMYASLRVAREVGGQISVQALSLGDKIRGVAQGYAGRISRRGAGAVAEGVINEKSWINQKTGGRVARVTAVPLVGRGLSYVSALGREETDKKKKSYKKEYGTYSDVGLKTMLERPYITRDKRSVIDEIRKERSDKDKARIENIKKEQRKEELRKIADDKGQDAQSRLAAMKLLGELDVQTELSETKKQLAAEKEKSAETKPQAPPSPKSA